MVAGVGKLERKPLLLLGPAVRKRFGEAGDGQLCWRSTIDYGGDDPRGNKGEGCQKSNMALAFALARGDLG